MSSQRVVVRAPPVLGAIFPARPHAQGPGYGVSPGQKIKNKNIFLPVTGELTAGGFAGWSWSGSGGLIGGELGPMLGAIFPARPRAQGPGYGVSPGQKIKNKNIFFFAQPSP